MLQIKEFAKLCGCTTSILRYYDHKDILKPYFIESFTGYRYYQNNQALEFYRIK
ncbi:MAG: MerR family DNA-binding transcriptional regulator [Thomasclavelia sp.]